MRSRSAPLRTAKQTVNGIDDGLDNVDVFPLVEATDVVGFSNGALMEDKVDGTGMVFHIEPVAYVLALAIDREGLAVTDIVDEERDELLGELVRAVVVGAIGDYGRHSIGVVIGTNEMVAACLAR